MVEILIVIYNSFQLHPIVFLNQWNSGVKPDKGTLRLGYYIKDAVLVLSNICKPPIVE